MVARTALILGAFLTLAGAGQPTARAEDDANKKLIEALQGEWQLTSRIENGNPSDAEFIKSRTLVFEGDSYSVYNKGKKALTLKYKVDASKKSALFDSTLPGESDQNGILKLEGDTLTICLGPLNGARATEFKSPKDKDWTLLVYKKVKK